MKSNQLWLKTWKPSAMRVLGRQSYKVKTSRTHQENCQWHKCRKDLVCALNGKNTELQSSLAKSGSKLIFILYKAKPVNLLTVNKEDFWFPNKEQTLYIKERGRTTTTFLPTRSQVTLETGSTYVLKHKLKTTKKILIPGVPPAMGQPQTGVAYMKLSLMHIYWGARVKIKCKATKSWTWTSQNTDDIRQVLYQK